jgi:predicted Zn-dependent protease with MMP-like domain
VAIDDPIDSLLDDIEDALEADDLERARKLVERARKQYPHDPGILCAHGDVAWDCGELEAALAAYREAEQQAPDSPEILMALAWCHFALCQFDEARAVAVRVIMMEENPEAQTLLGRLAERANLLEEADRLFGRAHRLDPDAFPLPFRIGEQEFRELVSEALDQLPQHFRAAMDGEIALLVEPVPSLELLTRYQPPLDPELLGLYSGIPLPERGVATTKLPDTIHLFQRNLEHEAGDRDELVEQITITVYHEVGHYFGLSDEKLEELDFG